MGDLTHRLTGRVSRQEPKAERTRVRLHGRARLVLEDVVRFGYPIMPPPTAPRGSEEYNRELDRNRALSTRRLDEMADRLCLPVAYLSAVLIYLEDNDVVDWRTGEVAPEYRSVENA